MKSRIQFIIAYNRDKDSLNLNHSDQEFMSRAFERSRCVVLRGQSEKGEETRYYMPLWALALPLLSGIILAWPPIKRKKKKGEDDDDTSSQKKPQDTYTGPFLKDNSEPVESGKAAEIEKPKDDAK
jgi:hypothetical protein